MGEHSDYEPPAGMWERWGETEPVRRALYPTAVAVVALLVGYGVLSTHLAALWLAVVAAVLIPGAAELARGGAWAPASVGDAVAEARKEAFADGVRAMTRRTPDQVATEVLDAYLPTREVPIVRPPLDPKDRPPV